MDSGRITCRCPFSHRCSREGQKKPQKKNTAKISKNYGKIPAVYQTFAEGASGVVRRSRWRCLGGGSAIRGSGSDQHRCRAAVETPFRRTRRLIARAAGWQRVGGSEGPASAPVSVAVAVAVVTTHPPPSAPLLPSCVLEGWRAWDGAHRMTLSRLGHRQWLPLDQRWRTPLFAKHHHRSLSKVHSVDGGHSPRSLQSATCPACPPHPLCDWRAPPRPSFPVIRSPSTA